MGVVFPKGKSLFFLSKDVLVRDDISRKFWLGFCWIGTSILLWFCPHILNQTFGDALAAAQDPIVFHTTIFYVVGLQMFREQYLMEKGYVPSFWYVDVTSTFFDSTPLSHID